VFPTAYPSILLRMSARGQDLGKWRSRLKVAFLILCHDLGNCRDRVADRTSRSDIENDLGTGL